MLIDRAHPSLRDNPGYFIVFRVNRTTEERLAHLKAHWYCCHLPRGIFDLCESYMTFLEETRHNEQAPRIVLVRYPEHFQDAFLPELQRRLPTLLIAPDDLLAEARSLATRLKVPIEAAPVSSLNQQLLEEHWRQIAALVPDAARVDGSIPSLLPINDESALRLAWSFLVRQSATTGLPHPTELPQCIEETYDSLLYGHMQMRALVAQMREAGQPSAPVDIDAAMRNEAGRLRLPVVLGALAERGGDGGLTSGFVSRQHRAWEQLGVKRPDPNLERDCFNLLVAHRTLAVQGAALPTLRLPPSLFQFLERIEDHWRRQETDHRKLWWLLQKLGRAAGEFFDEAAIDVMRIAESVTIVSDFPLGLAILPGDTSPFQCATAVSYRPTTPLMGALEYEMMAIPKIFVQDGFKVHIAECLPPEDPIFVYSYTAWRELSDRIAALENVECSITLVRSMDELNRTLSDNPCDVLILSAHGQFDAASNEAGLVIGGKRSLGHELNVMPLLVVLSACDVMPRAAGAMTIAELLLLRGAIAVLGSIVPVNVWRHSNLLVRFFDIMGQAISGRLPYRTLRDAWRATCSSNVAADILHAHPVLHAWAVHEWSWLADRTSEWEDAGRINNRHLYRDTEKLLAECARQRGLVSEYEELLRRSYLPESLFYMLSGRPERIILKDDLSAAYRRQSERLTILGNKRE